MTTNSYPFVLNGNTYDLSSFDLLAYVTGIPNSMSDLVRQELLLANATSVTSQTIGTGSKTFAATAGKAFRAGDIVRISSQAAPQTNYMYGVITAYNFSTGSMTVTVAGVVGSGTIASWFITYGGVQSAFIGDQVLSIENGGLGFKDSFVAESGASLGLGSPSMNMAEIYEEFAGSQGDLSASPSTPGRTAEPPWKSYNLFRSDLFQSGISDTTVSAGTVKMGCGLQNSAGLYGYLQYGHSGFVHVGHGRLTMSTVLTNVQTDGNYYGRWGLRCDGSGTTQNIFSYGGIGFEWNSQANGGRYVCVAGSTGQVTRKVTAIVPSSGQDHLAVAVDHDGNNVDFLVNGVYVANIVDVAMPTDGPAALMCPVYEADAFSTLLKPVYYIDSFYMRKLLLR